VSGTFGSLVNTNLPANFSDSLGYDANNAYLNLKLGFVIPGGLNVNQQNVANALTNFINITGGIPMVYGALTPAALTQASGKSATGAEQTTFDAMNLFLGLLTGSRRWSERRRRCERLCRRSQCLRRQAQTERRAGGDLYQGTRAGSDLRGPLKHLDRGIRRIAEHRRQCGGGIEKHDLERLYLVG
jgi:hypothetical protein